MAAERQAYALSDAGIDHLGDRCGVADRRDRHVIELLAQDLGDHRHYVLRATGAAVVAMVDQQHGRARIGESQRFAWATDAASGGA